jgi:putative membrane protein
VPEPRSFWTWLWPPPPIAGRLWVAIAAATVYTAGVWAVYPTLFEGKPVWAAELTVLNTAVIGVLVGFRTKAAYDRWWEGRLLWGQLVNHSRNLCLKLRELVRPDEAEQRAFAALVSVFPVALMRHLRGPLQLADLPGFEKESAAPAHVPAFVARRIVGMIAAWRTAGRIDGHMHQILDAHTSAMIDVCGACERIRNTPLPTSYLSLLRHGLVFGFALMPWAMAHNLGFWAVPIQAVLVYFLFGIELTAEAVEQPFGYDGDDLPLEAYCETIQRSAEDILS